MRSPSFLIAAVSSLLIASPAGAQTCPQSFNGTLDASCPTTTTRLYRDAVPATCAARKAPAAAYSSGTFAYQTFPLSVPGVPRCVVVTTDAAGCGGVMIFPAVYLGSFDPADVSKNLLAEPGSSPNPTATMSFISDPDASYQLMVGVSFSGTFCPSFVVSVDDCGPGMAVAPAVGAYGTSTIGAANTKTFTVHNNGTGDLSVSAVAVGGANADDFALSGLPALPATVPASGTFAFTVAFTPSAAGARAGTLTVTGDEATNPSQLVALSGTGTWLQVAPSPLAFGPATVGEAAGPLTVTLTNTSATDSRNVSALTIAGTDAADFALSPAPTLPATLGPGTTLEIPVAFAPGAEGSRVATLEIASDDPDAPAWVVGLTGDGAIAAPAVAPTSVSFGDQDIDRTSAARTIALTNNGLAPIYLRELAVEGADAALFSVTAPSALPVAVAAGATVNLSATFRPTSKGAKAATALLTVGGLADPVEVPLAGSGTERSSGCGYGVGPAGVASLLAALLLGLRRRRRD